MHAFDLQAHSTRSDGTLEPAEVVAAAAGAGVRLLALTDHDTVDGVEEALRAAPAHGVRLVPAVELSSVDPDGEEDLHVLGYGIDHLDADLAGRLEEFRSDRRARIGRMADALEDLGWAVDRALLHGLAAPGRPHLAAAALGHPANAARLREEGVAERDAFFAAYLLPGTPAYRRRARPTVGEAIAAVHHAGGLAVWAHPFSDVPEPREVEATVRRFVALGLDGVEAFYPSHDRQQAGLLARLAEQLELVSTGSSDFHRPGDRFLAFELHGHEPRLGPIAR
jgi:predicted metal-dependent phosphoesterase TrpH